MKIERYGKTEEEQDLLDKIKAREIVQEILNFGVSQKQIIQIVSLLAMELEDNQMMKNLLEITRQNNKSKLLTK